MRLLDFFKQFADHFLIHSESFYISLIPALRQVKIIIRNREEIVKLKNQ